jgi:hypothetical protein
MRFSLWRRARKKVFNPLLPVTLSVGLPLTALASMSASLNWQASPDATVTGYQVCFGGASQRYTNSITVGAVTNVLITGLNENTTYYFAAKSVNGAGLESEFSNEALFLGVTSPPNAALRLTLLPDHTGSDPLVFSLGAGTPVEATINPTNGVFQWTPGKAYAGTTNYMTISITDQANPALSVSETLLVVVGDYLNCQWTPVAVSAGQSGSLPLTVAASDSVTNLQITVAWPDDALASPTLTFVSPVIGGTLQHQSHQLIIQLQTAASQPLTGTNQVAQVGFQAVSGRSSAIYNLPATVSGNTAAGAAYLNVSAAAAEVAVIGPQSILRPVSHAASGRALSLYAQPGAYALQYTTSLAAPVTWTTLTSYQQTNLLQTVSLDASKPVVFYRLQQL